MQVQMQLKYPLTNPLATTLPGLQTVTWLPGGIVRSLPSEHQTSDRPFTEGSGFRGQCLGGDILSTLVSVDFQAASTPTVSIPRPITAFRIFLGILP